MAAQIIDKIRHLAETESAQVNAAVIEGEVGRLQRTFNRITHWKHSVSPKFFYRQAEESHVGERWNIYGKFIWWLCGVYLTNRAKAEQIVGHLETVIEWCRSQQTLRSRDFWQVEKDTTAILSQIRHAHLENDQTRLRRLVLALKANSTELLILLSYDGHGNTDIS